MLDRINTHVEAFLATGASVILLAEPASPHSLSGAESANISAFLKSPAAEDRGPRTPTTSSTFG